MRIVYHLGAHCTDEGGILRVLLRNRPALLEQGIAVPDPDRYPDLLRAAAAAFAGRKVEPGHAERLMDALLPDAADDAADRLVLSFEGFLAFPRDAVTATQLYPAAAARARGLESLFDSHSVEFHLAIRNPATWLPALSARRRAKGQDPVPDGFDASALRWSELVGRLRAACPAAHLTVWCDEDSPVMWHRILRAVAGHAEATELSGALALPASLMSTEGARSLAAWVAAARPATDDARAEGLRSLLDQYAQADKLDTVIDLQGWTAETVTRLSEAYDADCARIAAMEGVRFLTP
ncbi:MAG: hypothetical protein Q8K20_16840 [Gemmobacter sp.]|nr:hypothetical protein [Gemmobacter sp.]